MVKKGLHIWLIIISQFGWGVNISKAQSHAPEAHVAQIEFNIRFTENKGQWGDSIRYRAEIPYGMLFLQNNSFTYILSKPWDLIRAHPLTKDTIMIHQHAFKERFAGANPHPQIEAQSASSNYNNYFIGNDPAHWATKVRDYALVQYHNLYDNIDLKVYAYGTQLTSDYIVNPGGDASQIQIDFDGATDVTTKDGDLVINTTCGNIVEKAPDAYQEINGEKIPVVCKFKVRGKRVSFYTDDNYRKDQPLVIDPQLIFATYTGSKSDNWGFTATYDKFGNMFLGGLVAGPSYPIETGAFQTTYGGGDSSAGMGYPSDIAIMKLNPTGTTALWSTYIGGISNETPSSMIVDNDDNLYVYGRTYSPNFPSTSNAYDPSYNGGGDIVVFKLSSDGSQLLSSTFIGGSFDDEANSNPKEFEGAFSLGGLPVNLKVNYGDDSRGEIELDKSGHVFVASGTRSPNFPVTGNAYQKTFGGVQDGCLFEMSSDLSTLMYSTYIGGNNIDACFSIDMNQNGIYISGATMSTTAFLNINGGLNSKFLGGQFDGFVCRFDMNNLSSMLSASYIGTTANDEAYFVRLGPDGGVYLYGQTTGSYPIVGNVFHTNRSGQFVHELSSDLSKTIFSSVFGSNNGLIHTNISPTAFAIDTCGNIYVAGWGGAITNVWEFYANNMDGMPLSSDAMKTKTDNNDFYFAVFTQGMASMMFGSYFGGDNVLIPVPFQPGYYYVAGEEHVDGGTSRFDPYGDIYEAICGGCGGVSNLPATSGAWSSKDQSNNCNEAGVKVQVALTRVSADANVAPTTLGCIPLQIQFTNLSHNATGISWDFGDGTTSTEANPTHTFTTPDTFVVKLIAVNPSTCNKSDTQRIQIIAYNTILQATATPQILNFCDSVVANFTASSNGSATTYQWLFGDGTTGSGSSVSHVYINPGIYTVSLVASDPLTCNLHDTITESVPYTNKVWARIAGSSLNGCAPFTAQFSNNGFGGTSFLWNFGDGSTSNSSAPSHTFNSPGTYVVHLVVSDPKSCNGSDKDSVVVSIRGLQSNAAFTASPPGIDGADRPINFSNQSINAQTYFWNFGDGDTSALRDPTHQFNLSGNYNVCLSTNNSGNCPDTTCERIGVRLTPAAEVPNAFSPNGDGKNDVLYVRGQDIADMDFKVWNRWGQLVFESNNPDFGWDGTFNGKPQEMDVYVWTLNVKFGSGETAKKAGNVTLLR